MIEGTGEIGYTSANVSDWIGIGAFNPDPLKYGGSVLMLFGRRGPGGLMLGGEFGYSRLYSYDFVSGGERLSDTVQGFRLLIVTRFWFKEGAWFGEASAGLERLTGIGAFDAVRDPTLGLAAGTFFDLSDQLAIVAKVRGNVLFDQGAPLATVGLHTGLSYSLSR
jgi:hypothetical protein